MPETIAPPQSATSMQMLGDSGLTTTLLGMGTGTRAWAQDSAQIRRGRDVFLSSLLHAYEVGLRYYDLADLYGSHQYMRAAMKEGQLPREKLTLLTKTMARKPDGVRKDLDRFRKALDTDYFDIVLLHGMGKGTWNESLAGCMDVLSEAKEQEVAHAQLDVRIAELSLEISYFDHEQNGREYAAEKARVDMMTLRSPIARRVEQIDVEVGETVSAAIPVVRVVRIDPLWIDVHVSIEQAFGLELGQSASVVFSDDPENPVRGEINFIAAVADSGSRTLRTRLEVPNESNRPAGQNVIVILEDLND